MIRSTNIIYDILLCGSQGAILGVITGFSLVRSGGCLAGISVAERVFSKITESWISGTNSWFGPIPIGLQNTVSYGLATFTTFKAMQIAGVILSIPIGVQVIGAASALVLVVSRIYLSTLSTEELLTQHVSLKNFSNRIFSFEHQGKKYDVRIITNPRNKNIAFEKNHVGRVSFAGRFIVAASKDLPDEVKNKIIQIIGKDATWLLFNTINYMPILPYTAHPILY